MAGKPQRLNGQQVVFKRVAMAGAPIGEEVRTYSTSVVSQGVPVAFFVVLWRQGTVKATLLVGGLRGTVSSAAAVGLARKQQGRIALATALAERCEHDAPAQQPGVAECQPVSVREERDDNRPSRAVDHCGTVTG